MQLKIPIFIQFIDISKFFDKESLRDGMNTVYKAGISGKLYRLWFKLNQRTKIGIKTGSGTSEYKECGETIGQGSFGGALISAANLDDGINTFFEPSNIMKSASNPATHSESVMRSLSLNLVFLPFIHSLTSFSLSLILAYLELNHRRGGC